jgi:hypothetical protein
VNLYALPSIYARAPRLARQEPGAPVFSGSALRDSGCPNLHHDADQFTVTHDGAIVATGTHDQVWVLTATHDGDFAMRVAT